MPEYESFSFFQKAAIVLGFILFLIAGGYIRAWIDRNRRRY